MFKSFIDYLIGTVPMPRWLILLILLGLVLDLGVILSALTKKHQIGEE